MEPATYPDAIARMQTLLELFELGEEIMRQNLRRQFPRESDQDLGRRFLAWRWRIPGYDAPEVPAFAEAVPVSL